MVLHQLSFQSPEGKLRLNLLRMDLWEKSGLSQPGPQDRLAIKLYQYITASCKVKK